MKAVVYKNKNVVVVEEKENPTIQHPADAIIKVSSAAICGSDLHMYDGRSGIGPDCVFGHEIMGTIAEVGDAVSSYKPGDRVVVTFNIACGHCFNCVRGFTSACLIVNDKNPGGAFGYANMGPYDGGQAQMVRVPFADMNCIKLPGTENDAMEDDFLMLADIFPTAYHATELAKVCPGSTVAIYGAGPVGLLAAHSSKIRGASQIFVVDQSETRLALAKELGAVPINKKDGDPAEQIKAYRKANPLVTDSFLPGEEKMEGVMCGIDAVGYQAKSTDDISEEDPASIITQLAEIVNATGNISLIGVYAKADPEGKDDNAKKGMMTVPMGKIWEKGISIGMGQTPVKQYSAMLRDLIIAGIGTPGKIISHRVSIDDAPEAYKMFDFRGIDEGKEYTKVVLKPNA